ncbi:clathrin interactor 1-like isoform X2 [Mya arenaria]|uniref:clathrin interactor 1-like isoform X2 n=1 Tax=Mya arenaria TaxID=6604 RepID=UPI0022E30970|nr:clathrin interactor 1-like isoform X2 [Mya arenaria]
MYKIRELTEKVTNVVMNYSEVETKVREATNDDAWGPHGSACGEISQYTYTYEHFPEVMGMLWKRMFHENKKSWRRTYKSLTLLIYLIRNGSERVVTGAREHLYDLRGLENYTFTDEHGKDQGLNVRHKAKEIIDLIQNDERLRDERKKAKKNKDKYTGMSGDGPSSRFGGYSDRYDENPRKKEGRLGEIDDWNDGKRSVVDGAVGKVKEIWNKTRGMNSPDETVDYSERSDRRGHDVIGFSDEVDRNQLNDDDFEFKDSTNDYKSESTRSSNRSTPSSRRSAGAGKAQIDLGAAASKLGKTSETQTSSKPSFDAGPSLIDMGNPSGGGAQGVADFADFQSAGNDFNPRASVQAQKEDDFADFSSASFPSPTREQNGGFADFSSLNSSQTQTNASNAANASSPDLFDVFSSVNGSSMQPSVPIQPSVNNTNNMGSMSTQGFMGNMGSANMGMGVHQPNLMGQSNIPRQPNLMSSNTGMMSSQQNMMMSQQNMMMSSQPNMMMSSQPNMMMSTPNMMSQPSMMSAQPNISVQPNMMGMQQNMVQQRPGMMQPQGMMGTPGMMPNQPQPAMGYNQPASGNMMGMMQPAPGGQVSSPSLMAPRASEPSPQPAQAGGMNTWSGDASKVNISLDALSPAAKFQQHNRPSMNQLQQKSGGGVMAQPAGAQGGMGNLSMGMSGMNLGGQPPMMAGGGNMGMGMHGGMMGGPRMAGGMAGNSNFQQKTDNAFAVFGSMK